jgi:hypothetical protein
MSKFERRSFFAVGALLGLVFLIVLSEVVRISRLNKELGPLHCGQVEVVTPSGAKALEHQCWRSK